MRRNYSRLASVEERKNVRSASIFIGLTIAAVAFIYFVGIPASGKFAAFISDLKKSTSPISKGDKTPPAPPRFNTYPLFTNQESLSLTGNTEPGATVKLSFNGAEQEMLADKDGGFTFTLKLIGNDNKFAAVTVDSAGNISQRTEEFKVVFDNKPPDLTVNSPQDGTQFFGANQRQATIQGETEGISQVTINDRIIAVDDSGKFQYTTTLNDGENKFVIKSVDKAGNNTEKELTLNFSS